MKEFLSQRDIPFVERDIAVDEQAMDELTSLGYFTTPVVRIDNEIVVGFDQTRLESLLE